MDIYIKFVNHWHLVSDVDYQWHYLSFIIADSHYGCWDQVMSHTLSKPRNKYINCLVWYQNWELLNTTWRDISIWFTQCLPENWDPRMIITVKHVEFWVNKVSNFDNLLETIILNFASRKSINFDIFFYHSCSVERTSISIGSINDLVHTLTYTVWHPSPSKHLKLLACYTSKIWKSIDINFSKNFQCISIILPP